MKVYTVIKSMDYNSDIVSAVFSTEELAEDYIKTLQIKDRYNDYLTMEFEVDKVP